MEKEAEQVAEGWNTQGRKGKCNGKFDRVLGRVMYWVWKFRYFYNLFIYFFYCQKNSLGNRTDNRTWDLKLLTETFSKNSGSPKKICDYLVTAIWDWNYSKVMVWVNSSTQVHALWNVHRQHCKNMTIFDIPTTKTRTKKRKEEIAQHSLAVADHDRSTCNGSPENK